MARLVLASGSRWRRQLLDQLQLPYHSASPDIDERPRADESPAALVERLALTKTEALRRDWPAHLIVGSDQAAVFQGDILGKPADVDAARAQLARFSGQRVSFITGLALLDTLNDTLRLGHERYDVEFRQLSASEIANYIERESPLDCAGSFRMEGLGITLFKRLQGDDPNTLIGLPLIRLCQWLSEAGLDPLN